MYDWKSWGKSNFCDIRIKIYYTVISILIGMVCFIPLNNYWNCCDIYSPFYILSGLTTDNLKLMSVVITFFLVEHGLISSFRWYCFKNQILYISNLLWHVMLDWQCSVLPIDVQIERQHTGAPDCVELFKYLVGTVSSCWLLHRVLQHNCTPAFQQQSACIPQLFLHTFLPLVSAEKLGVSVTALFSAI